MICFARRSVSSYVRKNGLQVRNLTTKPRENIGILGIETYFPKQYVCQRDLEKHDGVKEGKYTIGLGQEAMSFCGDREDMNSMAMTAVHNLLEKNNIDPREIGRIEVGTETIVDKSKSVKSCLMQLFEEHGNSDIEGIDTTNACYGGTSALFNSLHWVESSYWDGRYAIVIAGDIAVYEKGPARPTGGAGTVAMLIGPNSPLSFEQGIRGTYMEHAWDFYKPKLTSEYPTVDGKLSNDCYIRALDNCFDRYAQNFEKITGKPFNLNDFNFCAFHTPYSKLVQKSWARLHYLNVLKNGPVAETQLQEYLSLPQEETYSHRDIFSIAQNETKECFGEKVARSLVIPKHIGNSYCGSLYSSLQGLIDSSILQEGDRVGMFSYGSGLAATLFSLRVTGDYSTLQKGVTDRLLNERTKETAEEFEKSLELRERVHNFAPYQPIGDTSKIFPGTYVLDSVDDLYRRHYTRV